MCVKTGESFPANGMVQFFIEHHSNSACKLGDLNSGKNEKLRGIPLKVFHLPRKFSVQMEGAIRVQFLPSTENTINTTGYESSLVLRRNTVPGS